MPKVKAAVLERSRRSTAGKRMASLIGKAQENDDAFWSHSIWSESGGGFSDNRQRKRKREEDVSSSGSEDEGSGDDQSSSGSYRMSDEDPEIDTFDSDFDESESDEEGSDGGERDEETDLRAEERREAASKRKKTHSLAVSLKSSAGRELLKRKSCKMTKRGPLGEGWNEGLVLNQPPGTAFGAAAPAYTQNLASKSMDNMMAQSSSSLPVIPKVKPKHAPSKPEIESVRTVKAGVPWSTRNLRTGSLIVPASSNKPTSKRKAAATLKEKKLSKKRQFTQEELIFESVKLTEMESAKWLSYRKRSKEDAAKSEKATASGIKKSSINHKVFRFHSRRGCSHTLTFLDMDHLPDILSGSSSKERKSINNTHKTAASAQSARRCSHGDRGSMSSGSNNIAQRSSNNQTIMVRSKTHFPFVAPTMVAEMKSNGPNLKVVVTQEGVPVSPPNVRSIMGHSSLAEASQRANDSVSTATKYFSQLLPVRCQSERAIKQTQALIETEGNIAIDNRKEDVERNGAKSQHIFGGVHGPVLSVYETCQH